MWMMPLHLHVNQKSDYDMIRITMFNFFMHVVGGGGPSATKKLFFLLLSPPFLKKQRGYCNRLHPSNMLSPPKSSNEIQPNLVCELLTWMGCVMAIFFFWPSPLRSWGGVWIGQISFNFNYKVNFKDFYTKLCVCSHKWKIQNISDGIFILSPGSCPRGGTLGVFGCPGGQKNFFSNMVMWHIKSKGMTSRTEYK